MAGFWNGCWSSSFSAAEGWTVSAVTPEPGDAQTLAAALGKDLVSATIADYQSTSPANYLYKGRGNLVLKNVSPDTVTLVLPYGMRFTDSGKQGAQDMAIFPGVP